MKPPSSPACPKSVLPKRVGLIFHRCPKTKWSVKEIKAYLGLHPIDEEELALVERYYARNWPPRHGQNILRTDLLTLLNNWAGELDRARIWCQKHPIKRSSKLIPFPMQSGLEKGMKWTEEEQEKNLRQREQIAQLKARLKL